MIGTTAPKKPVKKKPTLVKYDWGKIQVEFFKSSFEAVSPFLMEKYGIDVDNN